MWNDAVAYYQRHRARDERAVMQRKTQLQAFADLHGLRVVRSYEGEDAGDAFEEAVRLARAVDGLLLVTHDTADDEDVHLMVRLTQMGVTFIAVNVRTTPDDPSP